MAVSPLLVAGFQKGAGKPRKPKRIKGTPAGETKNHASQVGELAGAHMPVLQIKAPSHKERAKENAMHEKHSATRDWVAGRISSKKHAMIHARANHILKNPGKYFGKGRG